MSRFQIRKVENNDINAQILKFKRLVEKSNKEQLLNVNSMLNYQNALKSLVSSFESSNSVIAYYNEYLRKLLNAAEHGNIPTTSWGQSYDTVSIDNDDGYNCLYRFSADKDIVTVLMARNFTWKRTINGYTYYSNLVSSSADSKEWLLWSSIETVISGKDPASNDRWADTRNHSKPKWDDNGNAPRFVKKEEAQAIIAWQKEQGIYPVIM